MSEPSGWELATVDGSDTYLSSGTRVQKDSVIIEAIGAVEELAGWLAVLAEGATPAVLAEALKTARNDVYELLQQLNTVDVPLLGNAYVRRMEKMIDSLDPGLPVASQTALPGGCLQAALCAVARSVCRRAERRLVTFCDIALPNGGGAGITYLDRLSALLAVAMQTANKHAECLQVHFDPTLSLANCSLVS